MEANQNKNIMNDVVATCQRVVLGHPTFRKIKKALNDSSCNQEFELPDVRKIRNARTYNKNLQNSHFLTKISFYFKGENLFAIIQEYNEGGNYRLLYIDGGEPTEDRLHKLFPSEFTEGIYEVNEMVMDGGGYGPSWDTFVRQIGFFKAYTKNQALEQAHKVYEKRPDYYLSVDRWEMKEVQTMIKLKKEKIKETEDEISQISNLL
jgi:hypothetical protein